MRTYFGRVLLVGFSTFYKVNTACMPYIHVALRRAIDNGVAYMLAYAKLLLGISDSVH